MHCANFPRHLGRLITRCLIAHPDGADTIELAHWAYGEVLPRYARHNVRRFYREIDRMFVPYMRLDQRMPLWWWTPFASGIAANMAKRRSWCESDAGHSCHPVLKMLDVLFVKIGRRWINSDCWPA